MFVYTNTHCSCVAIGGDSGECIISLAVVVFNVSKAQTQLVGVNCGVPHVSIDYVDSSYLELICFLICPGKTAGLPQAGV